MNDELLQVGTSIARNYYNFLDFCLDGTLDAFQLPAEALHLVQLDQDFKSITELEQSLHSLEERLNAGLSPVSPTPPTTEEEAHSPAFVAHGIKSPITKISSAKSAPLKSLDFAESDNTTDTLSEFPSIPTGDVLNPKHIISQVSPLSSNKNTGYSVNPLDNSFEANHSQGPISEEEPLRQAPKNVDEFAPTLPAREIKAEQQKEKTKQTGSLGNLMDFAQHFSAPQPQKQIQEEPFTSSTEQEAEESLQVTNAQRTYSPPPKGLKSYADFISQQKEDTNYPLTANNQQPTTTAQLIEERQQDKGTQPSAAVPESRKVNQNDSALTIKKEITEFKNSLVSNPAFIHQFLSTDNKPLPPEVDYDELIDNLAKHLYWEYKRYYGK